LRKGVQTRLQEAFLPKEKPTLVITSLFKR